MFWMVNLSDEFFDHTFSHSWKGSCHSEGEDGEREAWGAVRNKSTSFAGFPNWQQQTTDNRKTERQKDRKTDRQ